MLEHKTVWILALTLLISGHAWGEEPLVRRAAPILLTFDIELESDIEFFRELDPPAPCTLFVTGRFAETYPDVVRKWSEQHEIACHTMTHPHLTELDRDQQFQEIHDSAEAIYKATGTYPIGFRAPYLESNADTHEILSELGFRYQSSTCEINHRDSSDEALLEFPISDSTYKDRIEVASDYNMYTGGQLDDDETLEFLVKLYNERRLTGRPLVVLLHPHQAIKHASVLKRLITYAQKGAANFTCFRDWLADADSVPVQRRAAWVSRDAFVYEPTDLVRFAGKLGLTDLIVNAYDPAEGALFGEGRPSNTFFTGMVDAGKKAGIKIHAWVPLCFDPYRLKSHPEWGMVDPSGKRSTEWICPTNQDWRKELVDTLSELMGHYAIDGLQFDYLRFPNADVCRCSTCLQELSRRSGTNWRLDQPLVENSRMQTTWLHYRTDLIHELTTQLVTLLRKMDPRLTISAAVKPEGAINFEGVQIYGQSYELLAPLLDFLAPMAYHQLEQKPIDWVRAVQISGQWRAGFTPIWNGIQAFEEPHYPPMGQPEFAQLLDSMQTGSQGVALFSLGPLLSIVTGNGQNPNMTQGTDELVRRWSLGQKVSTPDVEESLSRLTRATPRTRPTRTPTGATSIWGWLGGLLGGATLVALGWALQVRWKAPLDPVFPELPLATLETLAAEPQLTGTQCALVMQSLRTLKPQDLEHIPITKWDLFVAKRLEEALTVACPFCDALNEGLWLQPVIVCTACHHRFPIHQSAVVKVSRASSADLTLKAS